MDFKSLFYIDHKSVLYEIWWWKPDACRYEYTVARLQIPRKPTYRCAGWVAF